MTTEPTTDTEATADELTPAQRLQAFADAYGITMETEFIPWSQSRNKGEKDPSLNFRVTLKRGDWSITTDYSMGYGNCQSYKELPAASRGRLCGIDYNRIKRECEHGAITGYRKPVRPTIDAVLWSLSMDASVLDAPTYEDWAGDYGFDPDSRKGEAVYRACLEIALKLRVVLGDDGLRELAEAGQDY